MKKRIVWVALLVILLGIVAGCAKTSTPAPSGNETTPSANSEMADVQEITYNNGTEPETADPGLASGSPEGNVIMQIFEGLTRLKDEKPEPGIAESWEVSDDGLHYTFHIRKDAKWSDGKPLTAKDFEYSWKRVLDPKLGSEYAYQLWYLKNGQAYNEGKITNPDEIGVKATDDYTLEVTLEYPTPYFLSLTSFYTLMPVRKDVVEANPEAWFRDPATLISNGPFKVESWTPQDSIVMVPNEYYWGKDEVKLKKLTFFPIDDETTTLSMWENGELDYNDNPPQDELDRLFSENKITSRPEISTYYYMFNVKKPPFDNPKVREAMALAIDREKIVKEVTRGGQTPALAFVPNGIPDLGKGGEFRQNGGDYLKYDVEKAKQLLAEAGYPDGKGFPEVELLYNTSQGHQRIAEAVQEMWKQNLGINVKLVNQEWQVYMDTRDSGNWQICRAGWIGDYLDAMTFLDMWITDGGNNDTSWSNPEYDKLIDSAKKEVDLTKRSELLHQAEKMLMEEVPIIPIYYYVDLDLIQPWVKDVYKSPMGHIFFRDAWVAKH